MSSSLKVVNAHRSRSKRRTVGVSAVALGALLATYAGALRNVGYAQTLGTTTTCSPGSTEVANDTALRNAVLASVDKAVICVTADITVSQTLEIDDTTITIEGSGNPTLSGGGVRQIINADFTGNSSDDTLTLLNLSLDGGNHAGQGGAVDVVGGDYADALVMSGVSATNNDATGGSGRGGAVAARNLASVAIDNSVFTDNQAVYSGGAIYLYRAGAVDVDGADFERNQTVKAAGGALYVGANAAVDPQLLTITNSDFIDNESGDGGGGAVGIRNFDDTVSMTSVSFIRNKALDTDALTDDGGAIAILSSDGAVLLSNISAFDNRSAGAGGFIYDDSQVASNPITITDLISTRNYADDSGGSLFVADGSLTIQNSTFTDDSAALTGGAVYAKADSLTVTDSGFYSAYTPKAGGAIYVDSATVYLHDSTFDGNSSGDGGGAIYHTTRYSDFTLAGGTFLGNKAVDSGGAIYVESENTLISGASFLFNQSQDSGGAIAVYEEINTDDTVYTTSTVTIQNSVFEANTAEFSGGSIHIYAANSQETTDDTLILSGLTFADDSAARDGGSIYVYAEGSLTISDVTATRSEAGFNGGFAALNFEDPSFPRATLLVERAQLRSHRALGLTPQAGSTGMGAALYLRGSRSAEITGTTIAGSIAAANGGGIYSVDDSAVTLVNSTITGNLAAQAGGGIFIDPNAAGSLDIEFTTIVGNSAGKGGGLATDDTVSASLSSTILSGNSATTSGADAHVDGSSLLTSTYSIFGSAATVTGATIDDDSNIFGDPKLNGLADNGGPTLTRLPQWNSPVIGAGDPNWSGTPAFDQRGSGFPRDAGGAVSIGAVQGFSPKPAPQPPTPVPPSSPMNVSGTARDGEATITWSAPSSSGSFPISSYQAVVSPGGQSCLVASSPCTITGLTNGTEYTVRVRALSGAGWGPFSGPSAPFTPETPPAPPVEKTMVITGSRGAVRGRPGVVISGSSTGMVGEQVAPWVKFPGQTGYTQGSARRTIDAEGDFTWQRRTGKKIYVYFRSLDSDVKSNRIIIRAR